MNKEEVFSMIWRNKHGRFKAIRYISDFLQISKKEAIWIYENEYLKAYPCQNGAQSPQNAPGAPKTSHGYKEAFTYRYSPQGILSGFRRMSDEY